MPAHNSSIMFSGIGFESKRTVFTNPGTGTFDGDVYGYLTGSTG